MDWGAGGEGSSREQVRIWEEKVQGETAGMGGNIRGTMGKLTSVEIFQELHIFEKLHLHFLKVSVGCKL